jgi:hypothetical protein
MTSSGAEVGQEFVRFFSDLLGTTKQTVPINGNVIYCGPCLDSSSDDILLASVTNELIQQTLLSIDNDKAPGPNGFSSLFFKRAWGIVGGDFYAVIKISLLLGKCLNKSIIPSSPWFLNLPQPTLQLISALSLAAM